jgi:hypothetical protein
VGGRRDAAGHGTTAPSGAREPEGKRRTESSIAHDELGIEGQDGDRITRLAERMRSSRAHTTTLDHHTVDYDYHRLDPASRWPELDRPRLSGF